MDPARNNYSGVDVDGAIQTSLFGANASERARGFEERPLFSFLSRIMDRRRPPRPSYQRHRRHYPLLPASLYAATPDKIEPAVFRKPPLSNFIIRGATARATLPRNTVRARTTRLSLLCSCRSREQVLTYLSFFFSWLARSRALRHAAVSYRRRSAMLIASVCPVDLANFVALNGRFVVSCTV